MIIQIGPVTLDLTPLLQAAAVSPLTGAWFVFVHGGWAVFAIVFFTGFKWWWVRRIALKYSSKWKWVLLAIDVPSENIQSPKAVENIMAHLAGAHTSANALEHYITGHDQPHFSLEIVSINGFIRFFIYTIEKNRDLVESAIFAQYPNAEIMVADDYAKHAPTHFPDPDWNIWGAEFILANKQAYPIRTWENFHDTTSEEAGFKDPMAAMLETMSSLRDHEQLWFQVLITPIKSGSWQEKSRHEVEKLAGIKGEHKSSFVDSILSIPNALLTGIVDLFLPGTPAEDHKKGGTEPLSQMLYLTPGEREKITAIEEKAAKLGFKTKIRAIYLARKDVFHKPRAVYGLIGAMKQFNTEDLNSFKPELHKVGTHTKYLWKEMRNNWRKNKIMKAYKVRSNHRGMHGYILNVEELATIWHFPMSESVKAPLVKKAESKRGEPPSELPVEFPREFYHQGLGGGGVPKGEPPAHLPEDKVPPNLPIA